MAGVRRRLRDVGTRLSGVLGVPVGETGAGPVAGPSATVPPVLESSVTTSTTELVPAQQGADTPDAVCVAAVDLALTAARELGGSSVGEHLSADADDHLVVTHSFAATLPGYRGWRWAVTVARSEDSEHVTVDEVVLLPGAQALVAPAWVPYVDRVRPGDLNPGDLLPPAADDPRLVPSFIDLETEDLLFELDREVGLGRPRALSLEGRLDAAERWYFGDAGPDTALAKAAPAQCASCGFLLMLSGSLRQAFGVCANAFAPDDGRVVSLDHGCGAHSEVVVEPVQSADAAGMAVEDDEFDLVPVTLDLLDTVPTEDAGGHSLGTVADGDPAEPFGHS